MVQDGFIITQGGLNLLAKCLLGKQLVFTRVTFGDSESNGVAVIVNDEDALLLTNLISPKQNLSINGEPTVEGGQVMIPFLVSNANISEGYWMRETGVFARDPDTQNEVLYAYSNVGDKGGWMFPSGGAFVLEQTYVAILAVGNAANISAVVSAETADLTGFATRVELQAGISSAMTALQEHIDSATPHPNATGSEEPEPTVDNAQIALINSRLLQAETNLANLYMQLKTENDLGAQPNLMLVENFTGETVCDNFVQEVTAATAGTSSITISVADGILPGSWYTLSDGVNSEFVQVTSVATNSGTVTVNLASNITNTYTISKTKLYRSTTTIGDGEAYGAGDCLSEIFLFTGTWIGRSETTQYDVLELYLSQASSFELEGDWAFTTDGYFTLA